jgi:hypothetical protein
VNTWHRAGRWVTAALLLAVAPVPVVVGRLLLTDRGATPATAAAVTVGVATTILCLLGSATVAVRLARPTDGSHAQYPRQAARHTAGDRRSARTRERRPGTRRWGRADARRSRRRVNQRRSVGVDSDL